MTKVLIPILLTLCVFFSTEEITHARIVAEAGGVTATLDPEPSIFDGGLSRGVLRLSSGDETTLVTFTDLMITNVHNIGLPGLSAYVPVILDDWKRLDILPRDWEEADSYLMFTGEEIGGGVGAGLGGVWELSDLSGVFRDRFSLADGVALPDTGMGTMKMTFPSRFINIRIDKNR